MIQAVGNISSEYQELVKKTFLKHELWLKDPDGTLIEIYARLTDDELNKMPEDMVATRLV